MLPIEAITQRVAAIVLAAMPEFADRIHFNRTLPLSYERNEVPAVTISQGEEAPNNDLSDWEYLGWIAEIGIVFTAAGTDESAIVAEMNQFRLRTIQAMMADTKLGLEWVLEITQGTAAAPVTDGSGSVIVKEIPTTWQVAYRASRSNPDIS